MKLTLQLKPLPSPEQTPILLATMERSNAAASLAARVGFEAEFFFYATVSNIDILNRCARRSACFPRA